MLGNKFSLEKEDVQISYNDAMAAMDFLFDEKIGILMNDRVDGYLSPHVKDIENLKELKKEFANDFQEAIDNVERRKQSGK